MTPKRAAAYYGIPLEAAREYIRVARGEYKDVVAVPRKK